VTLSTTRMGPYKKRNTGPPSRGEDPEKSGTTGVQKNWGGQKVIPEKAQKNVNKPVGGKQHCSNTERTSASRGVGKIVQIHLRLQGPTVQKKNKTSITKRKKG